MINTVFLEKMKGLPVNLHFTGKQLYNLAVEHGVIEFIEAEARRREAKWPNQGKYAKTMRGLLVENMFSVKTAELFSDVKLNVTADETKEFWWDFKVGDDIWVDVKVTSREKTPYEQFRTPKNAFTIHETKGPGQFHHLGSHQSKHEMVYLLMVNMHQTVTGVSDFQNEYVISPSWLIFAKDFYHRPGGFLLPADEEYKEKYRFRKENFSERYVKYEY